MYDSQAFVTSKFAILLKFNYYMSKNLFKAT